MTKPNEIYGIRSNNSETIPNEVYMCGVRCNNVDMTTNEVYGVCSGGTETIHNYVYGVRSS